MTLLIGSDDGLFRVDEVPFEREDAEQVLDCGMVLAVDDFDEVEGITVASTTGAYRSRDGGDTWEDLGVPRGGRYWYEGESQIWSLHATPDGSLYAGTNDPYLYRSIDGGDTWSELKSFRDIPSRGRWESPEDPHEARLRTLSHVPGRPDQLIAGVEAGGLHLSRDAGETWIDGRGRLTDDVHHILPVTEDVWLAATGYLELTLENLGFGHALGPGGIYRSVDAGETWTRLDTGNQYSYIRRVFVHDGTLFFCGGEGAPPAWEHDEHGAALFESEDFGRTFERVSYPGEPYEVIESWIVADGDILCGSGLFDVPNTRDDVDGRIMRRTDEGEYETVGTIAANIGRLEYLD